MKMVWTRKKGKSQGKSQGWRDFCLESAGVNRSSLIEKGEEGITCIGDSKSHRHGDTRQLRISGETYDDQMATGQGERAMVRSKGREVVRAIEWKAPCVVKFWLYLVTRGRPPSPQTPLLFFPTAKHTPS